MRASHHILICFGNNVGIRWSAATVVRRKEAE